ncbi:dUTP diphosphatase [Arthrobacter sp. A2-55]|uniref:dUTP diphosphatase n=1 Tax=Arthrobacter sp. A2-55 TaxID=2897337 RepID=UPI0021CD96B9|nr:dUTP diphosphatase [Arthrobacter sp. A2-55]MCU6479071.1 dUTP diphosphatase [Arthrobacter sp. A2-55]
MTLETIHVPAILKTWDAEPHYASPGDAGADLCAAHDVVLPAGKHALVKTGVSVALPDGYALFIHPRSGLALKNGITVLNSPGTIDSGFRGEIGVILHNTTDTDFQVNVGNRIAQAVVQRYVRAVFTPVEELPESERGTDGFGSTGGHASL